MKYYTATYHFPQPWASRFTNRLLFCLVLATVAVGAPLVTSTPAHASPDPANACGPLPPAATSCVRAYFGGVGWANYQARTAIAVGDNPQKTQQLCREGLTRQLSSASGSSLNATEQAA